MGNGKSTNTPKKARESTLAMAANPCTRYPTERPSSPSCKTAFTTKAPSSWMNPKRPIPARLLVLMKEIHWLIKSGCQFIIATHSPILLAYPDAQTYWLDEEGVSQRRWDELERVQTTRSFLDNPTIF